MRKIPRKLDRFTMYGIGGGASEEVTLVGESPLVLPSVYGGGLKSLKVKGGAITQEGAPTPDDPKPILIGGKELKIKGKNLIDFNAWVGSSDSAITNGSASFGNGTITISADADDCFTESEFRVSVKPSTTYTLSWVADSNKDGRQYAFLNGLTTSGNAFFAHNNVAKNLTFTTKADTSYITFRFGVQHANDSITYSNIQLEEGASVTAYEAYINEPHIEGQNLIVSGKNIANLLFTDNISIYSECVYAEGVESIKPNTTYTLSFVSNTSGMVYYTNENLFTSSSRINVEEGINIVTFTTKGVIAPELNYNRFYGWTLLKNRQAQSVSSKDALSNAQLEYGSTATAYEPFKEPTRIPLPLLIGSDEADITSGEVVRKWGVKVLDGRETDIYTSITDPHGKNILSIRNIGVADMPIGNIYGRVFCDQLKESLQNVVHSDSDDMCISVWSWGHQIIIRNNDCNNVAEYVNWIKSLDAKGTPLTLVYPLATPTTSQIPPATANTIKPTSVLTSYASSMDATYKAKQKPTPWFEYVVGLNTSVDYSTKTDLTAEGLANIILNSAPTHAIVIKLSASDYNKCVSGGAWYTEISSALSSKPLVSLAK